MGLADFIRNNMEAILKEWEEFAASLPPGAQMKREQLRDEAEQVLRVIAERMSRPESKDETKARSRTPLTEEALRDDTAGGSHAVARHQENFDLNQMVSEYRALRESVMRLWAEQTHSADEDDLAELTRFNEAMDRALVESIARYSNELSRSRQLLIGVLGHDLRTPLGAIQMSAELLSARGELGNHGERAVQRIRNSVQHMSELISALLDVTRMRLGGGLSTEPQPIDLADICEQTIEEIRAAYPGREVELEIRGDLHGCWDGGRMAQLVSNLVANAIHHGAKDQPIDVHAAEVDGEVEFWVYNRGEPIPEAAIDRIFEPMANLPVKQTQASGLGLGLYIARAIADAHGGKIEVDSSREQGTTFRVTLPRETGK
jgi:signal transduction histidine kinase